MRGKSARHFKGCEKYRETTVIGAPLFPYENCDRDMKVEPNLRKPEEMRIALESTREIATDVFRRISSRNLEITKPPKEEKAP